MSWPEAFLGAVCAVSAAWAIPKFIKAIGEL